MTSIKSIRLLFLCFLCALALGACAHTEVQLKNPALDKSLATEAAKQKDQFAPAK